MVLPEARTGPVAAGPGVAVRSAPLPAGTRLRLLAIALDVLLALLAIAAAALLAAVTERNPLGAWLLIGATALGSGGLWLWWRWTLGGGPAHALLGLRTVDGATGMPDRPFRRGRDTLRIRAGADPLRLEPAPVRLSAVNETAPLWFAAKGIVLVFDDGSKHIVRHATVIGRDPELDPANYLQLAVPDLSRSMAMSHVLLRMDGDEIVVTDLGDAAGTWIVEGGRERRLPRGDSQRVPFGSQLRLGRRRLALYRRSGMREAR
ncbi:MAG: FHA domain-containing protein [Pseudoclavibacter sp.]|nr:FHA domain-containing protein [Pseudoclavibacter sp.]